MRGVVLDESINRDNASGVRFDPGYFQFAFARCSNDRLDVVRGLVYFWRTRYCEHTLFCEVRLRAFNARC